MTLSWEGSVNKTLSQLNDDFKSGSRVRIKSDSKIPLKYSTKLIQSIKEMGASEVIFKEEQSTDISHVNTGTSQILKADLRNADVLLRLLKEHYKASEMHEDEWAKIYDLLRKYVTTLTSEDVTRNVRWSLRRLKFSNLFSYGSNNTINFDALSGLVGLFGPNRSGKSSIPGTLLYTLFNGTDRGSIKNILLCNTRKQSCVSRAVINLNGKDYVIERSTNKKSNKSGDISAATNLRIWELIDNKLVECTGEQRSDTDRILRKLIGTSDDFHLMSIATQSDDNSILKHGSTKRRQILSRFLDIDVLQQIHELARDDVRQYKAILKTTSDADLSIIINDKRNQISDCELKIDQNVEFLESFREDLLRFRTRLAMFEGFKVVSESEVIEQRSNVEKLSKILLGIDDKNRKVNESLNDSIDKISRLEIVLNDYDIELMKNQLDSYKKMRSSVESLQQLFLSEQKSFERNKKTISILQDVPCGDNYPTCKFIKDAHEMRPVVDLQENKVSALKLQYEKSLSSLNNVDEKKLNENLQKVEKLKERLNQLRLSRSSLELQISQNSHEKQTFQTKLDLSKQKLQDLESRTDQQKNNELTSLRNEMISLEMKISSTEKTNLSLATLKGKLSSEIEKLQDDQQRRESTLQKVKYYEVIESSFSKNGIQDVIISSLLPAINEEISTILSGIVNFTVELEKLPNDDQIEIYINYGDGDRRVLEVCCGMEKTISSIALRTALNNVSTLPKSDIFIIDEGFGTLDETSITECSILLQSLKRYFKTILIISHVDAIKDIVDQTIEITRIEKDSKIEHN